jgi:hypothetical protein
VTENTADLGTAFCEYVHRIESEPLTGGAAACPVFGHDCPGGAGQADACREALAY